MAACPKCSAENIQGAVACARCGVVFARLERREKLMATRPAPPPRRDTPGPPPTSAPTDGGPSSAGAMTRIGAMALVVAASVWFTFGRREPAAGTQASVATAAASVVPAERSAPEPVDIAPPATSFAPALPPVPPAQASGPTEADVAFLQSLNSSLASRDFTPSTTDVDRVEEIRGRVGDPQIAQLLVVALSRMAETAGVARRFSEATALLARAKSVDSTIPHPFVAEAVVCGAASDWACAEAASRRAEALGVNDAGLAYGLAFALYRQDRGRDALEVLDRPLLARVPPAQKLRALILGAQTAQADKAQFSSDRFNVRFDGEEHSGVARDVLRILDRYYLLLAETYDHRPQTIIPVILYSQRDYYTATGAPGWSGGQYSSHSGRIDIPIRGLPSNLDPDGEGTVIHELSHAFVGDMTGGVISGDGDMRDLNEGLAQYMEGERVEKRLSPAELKRLATTQGGSVGDFYTRSLVFVEFLMKSRGQRDINDLLRAMKETGSAAEAFQKVFGETPTRMRERAFEAFWRRYS